MSAQEFETSSLGWQFYLLQKRVGESIEYFLSRFDVPTSNRSQNLRFSQWFLNLVSFLFWVAVSFFVLWLMWRLWKKFNPHLYAWLNEAQSNEVRSQKNEQEINSTALLSQSQEFYRQNRYRDACKCLYLALLQFLHEKDTLRHKKSRTDREYLQILRLSNSSMQPYETLITTHEQICFDEMEVEPTNYEQCRQAYKEITQE
ncbi:hypothetical protein NIES4071_96510 [Calothrix sp. NIES-4071]|nr:hypothetical protein NIES4071_96510 [Calothrix sp. NIES-4071]BAZ63916.1 hypothetical protein NIES4105_96440 [Calothrix sp. NIES-4105]